MAFRDSFDECPRCGITLEDAASARGCRGCGGVFVEEPVLVEMLLQMLPPPPRAWGRLSLAVSSRSEPSLACPTCGDAMKAKSINAVELDHCSKHGVWFDQDELRITLYRVADRKNLPPFEEWAPPQIEIKPPPPPPPVPTTPPPKAAPSPTGAPMLSFHIIEQGKAPRAVATNTEVIKIGKTQACQIRVDSDTAASRMHAIIEATRDSIRVIDLGASTGTQLNGELVADARVEVGDTIRAGTTDIILVGIS